MIRIETISTDSPHYDSERDLRNRVLLRPIGLPDHAWEQKDPESAHIVAILNDQVVGCVLLYPHPEEPQKAQLLQMATDSKLQGQGIGQRLVEALKEHAKAMGVATVFCHARCEVQGFYQKLGFQATGGTFEEVGLKHQLMELSL